MDIIGLPLSDALKLLLSPPPSPKPRRLLIQNADSHLGRTAGFARCGARRRRRTSGCRELLGKIKSGFRPEISMFSRLFRLVKSQTVASPTETPLTDELPLDPTHIPKHIAIIMDGNRAGPKKRAGWR
jgi:hypothetical protein